MQIHLTHFTDPACPFALSAEPIRFRLLAPIAAGAESYWTLEGTAP